MGRTGKWFCHEHFGVKADIMTIAKGIACGYPLAAIAAATSCGTRCMPGSMGGTYGGNAVACAAGVATIDAMREEGMLENAARQGEKLQGFFTDLQETYPAIGEVRGKGLMAAIECVMPGTQEPNAGRQGLHRRVRQAQPHHHGRRLPGQLRALPAAAQHQRRRHGPRVRHLHRGRQGRFRLIAARTHAALRARAGRALGPRPPRRVAAGPAGVPRRAGQGAAPAGPVLDFAPARADAATGPSRRGPGPLRGDRRRRPGLLRQLPRLLRGRTRRVAARRGHPITRSSRASSSGRQRAHNYLRPARVDDLLKSPCTDHVGPASFGFSLRDRRVRGRRCRRRTGAPGRRSDRERQTRHAVVSRETLRPVRIEGWIAELVARAQEWRPPS